MSPEEFYLNTPLYVSIEIVSHEQLISYIGTSYCRPFHGYNPIDKFETTFKVNNGYATDFDFKKSFHHVVELRCLRSSSNFVFFVSFDAREKTLTKSGQLPSVADFQTAKAKQYDKIFNKSYLKEYTKAIGLAAHGVGIGSFVYLRRIFESLIYEAAAEVSIDGNFDEENFRSMRMAEKITYLKSQLPSFLVENKDLYSILSLGIHELTEEVCLEHFDVVKVGIEFILDEKLEKYQKQKKIEEASARIKNASSVLKNNINKLD